MDADRFDALSRALSAGHTRRRVTCLLGGLSLGGLLTNLGSDEAAAAPLNGGARCTEGSQCKTGTCLSSGKCSCSKVFPTCKQPANQCKQATCDSSTKRCVARNKAKGATCNDGMDCTVNDACDGQGQCIGTPKHGRCPSADPCTEGRCRPTDARRDANGCVVTQITTGECAEGTCTSSSDCCPPEFPNCAGQDGYKFCNEHDVCQCPDFRPRACTVPGNFYQCQRCCNDADCADDPWGQTDCWVEGSGFCQCPTGRTLCQERGAGAGQRCVDLNNDNDHCGFCQHQCTAGFETCANGNCMSS